MLHRQFEQHNGLNVAKNIAVDVGAAVVATIPVVNEQPSALGLI